MPSSSKRVQKPKLSVSDSAAAASFSHGAHKKFWDALPDHEFFGPSLTHIYFYSEVNEETVTLLRSQILEAAKGTQEHFHPSSGNSVLTSPKPIAVHVHSPGGDVWAGNWLLSLFNQVHVPICTVVDSISASAATFLTVSSPYRVVTSFSRCMLHDYWGAMMGKREEMLAIQSVVEQRLARLKRMYLSRSRFTSTELDALMRRDIWLDADTCMKKGIADRLVRPDRTVSASSSLTTKTMPFFKTNWNVMYSTCSEAMPQELDALLSESHSTKPVVFNAPGGMECMDIDIVFAYIPRVQSFSIPIYGVVDNDLSWFEMLPVQYCHRRYMYDNAHVVSHMAYVEGRGRLQDIVHNTQVERALIVRVLKERGRPTKEFLDDIMDRPRHVTADECLRMGLIDEIVRTGLVDSRR
jgi:ATP-dependent protease ClpP protease subunit